MQRTLVVVAGDLVGKTVAQIREELGIEGTCPKGDEYVPYEGERLEFVSEAVVLFQRSDELRKALGEVRDPVYLLRAIGPKKITLGSGCEEQVALNGAIRDYIRGLAKKAKAFSEEDLGLAVDAYREAKKALGFCNTQRTVHIPSEILEAEEAFEDLIEGLDPLAHLFPQEVQPVFWKARAFRNAQALTATIDTPYGPMTVGVERKAKDPRWYPFVEWRDQSGESRKEKAAYYIAAGTLSGKGSLNVSPLYEDTDGREFWGVEALWTTRTEDRFAWEIRMKRGYPPRFSLVRENPSYRDLDEVRQGDVLFIPREHLFGGFREIEASGIHLVRSCRFEPVPVRWLEYGDQYVAQFPEGTTHVVVSHPDHRTIKVRVGKEGVQVRSVGGRTHFQPGGRRGD